MHEKGALPAVPRDVISIAFFCVFGGTAAAEALG